MSYWVYWWMEHFVVVATNLKVSMLPAHELAVNVFCVINTDGKYVLCTTQPRTIEIGQNTSLKIHTK